jgi:RND family efflux transporter MFP subunit
VSEATGGAVPKTSPLGESCVSVNCAGRVGCPPATLLVLATLLLNGTGGCGQSNQYVEPDRPEVIVTTPVRRSVTSYLDYTGTTQAVARIDLRARVRGFLKQKLFKEGSEVKAGQLLLVIDEETFQIRLEQAMAKQEEAESALRKAEESKAIEVAQAQLELDLSQLTLARLDEARNRQLLNRRAGAKEDLDKSEATRKKIEAQIKADRANLEQIEANYAINILTAKSGLRGAKAEVRNAQIDLGYCRLTAPIDGRISRSEVDVGNYVGDGFATVLATIVKTDPVRAFINVSENDLLRIDRMVRQGKRADHRNATLPMEMALADETGYPHLGVADYTDPVVDAGTGTVRIRGVFPNPDGAIVPGLFVRVRLPLENRENALLVPSRALGSDQSGEYLLVVGKDDVVVRRGVTVGAEVDGMRVVDGEIGPSDKVVVDGLLQARPGTSVVPKPQEEPPAVAAALTTPRSGSQP